MPARTSGGGMPSQRQLRVGELVRHALAEALSRGDIHDPVLETTVVTVPEVRMSPDLKIATCFVIPLGGKDGETVVKALARNARYLRGLISRKVTLKFMPDLRFRYDASFDQAAKIDAILRSDDVQRDLKKNGEPEEDA